MKGQCNHDKIATDSWSFKWCKRCGAIKFLANQKPAEVDEKKVEWNYPENDFRVKHLVNPIASGKDGAVLRIPGPSET